MSTKWSDLHVRDATLLARLYYKEPRKASLTVPSSWSLHPTTAPAYLRAHALGCGGEGDQWGGGGAYARSVVPVSPGTGISLQVGEVSTESVIGDSWVKFSSGATICYADRGRGAGTRGLAANSIGDVTRDGVNGSSGGIGGSCASDSGDYGSLGIGGLGATYDFQRAADYGCGGLIQGYVNEFGTDQGIKIWGAGTGLVVLEFFDRKPGF